MRYIRPFEIDGPAGTASKWLLSPEEEAGCTIRLQYGGGDVVNLPKINRERMVLITRGNVSVISDKEHFDMSDADIVFVPAGAGVTVDAPEGSTWVEIESLEELEDYEGDVKTQARPLNTDEMVNFENTGFHFYPMVNRDCGSQSIRVNACHIENRVGSPDWHIHAFIQMYIIQEGEMTVEIGRQKFIASANSLVVLPAGVVHRNFNISGAMEKHVSLLIPEPPKDAIFDYGITIHEEEAQMMKDIPTA